MNATMLLADIYLRLSDEEICKGESGSIINQRKIINKYCEDNDIIIVREFVDDGFSGSNFDRPGFKNMLQHLQSGLANTVITKDLSRLGRDMAESSSYAEKIFPEMGIRYLAISDNFDSEEVNIFAPFQFAMNDVYLRDTSRKIKQVIYAKRQDGEYCTCAPFGYMKNPNNKSSLIPNPDTAPIVQYIFSLAKEGNSSHLIADILTEDHYVTPLKYRAINGNFTDKGISKVTDEWNHTTVKRILKNEAYLGHTILGKTKKASLKSKKKISIPKEEWIVTQNTHQPLVSQEDFDVVQNYISKNTKAFSQYPVFRKSIFRGLVFCKNCGAAMCSAGTVYKDEREKYWFLACNNISRHDSKKCDHGARIKYSTLIEIITKELNTLIDLTDEQIEKIIDSIIEKENDSNIYKSDLNQKEQIEQRLLSIDKVISKMYQDNVNGLIDDERLSNMVKDLTSEANALKKKLNTLKNKDNSDEKLSSKYIKFFNAIKSLNHITELTPEILSKLIERIEVSEKILPEGYKMKTHDNIPCEQKITIYYKFIGKIGSEQGLKQAI